MGHADRGAPLVKRLRKLLAERRTRDLPRVGFAPAPYVLGRDDRGRIIYSSSPTLPRRL